MALIWVLGGTEMLFWNFDRGDLSPGWRWVEIIETWCDINVSHPSRSQLNSMQVSIYVSHLHPGHISLSCGSWKLHLLSIQVQSETHPGIITCVLLPFMSCLTCIHATPHPHPHRAPFHIHPCPKILQFMLQPGHDVGISHPSISCLTSIQVKRIAPQLHPSSTATYPGLKMCVSTQSRPHRTAKTQYLLSISTQD